MIESTGLLLDSINENMTHSHEHSHEHSKGQKHDKRVNMSVVSDVPSKSKITKKNEIPICYLFKFSKLKEDYCQQNYFTLI